MNTGQLIKVRDHLYHHPRPAMFQLVCAYVNVSGIIMYALKLI